MVYTEEEDGENRGLGRYLPLAMFSSYVVSVLGRETLEDHSQLPKKANKCSIGQLFVCMAA